MSRTGGCGFRPGSNCTILSVPGEFDLPMVFAGYGVTKAEEGYDDYAGLDCRGKMVVVLCGEK